MRKPFLLFMLLLLAGTADASSLIGGNAVYIVQKGDTPELISARLGVSRKKLIKDNAIDPAKPLVPGTPLNVVTRRIVPDGPDFGILINIPERVLYYFRDGQLQTWFPVGLGMSTTSTGTSWKTPDQKFTILRKEKNPTWYVPESIQREMQQEGKEVKTLVPPGPDNPLGRYALHTSLRGILIHETIKPASVHQFRSHGCIRVMPEHMEKFFSMVEVNTPGELIYKPVKAAVSDGRVFLEVHKDYYRRTKNLKNEARNAIEQIKAADKVDWSKVEVLLQEKSGIAEDVSR